MLQSKKRGQTTDYSNILSNLAIYRFYLAPSEKTLYINIHSSVYKNWTNKGLRKNNKYFQNYVVNQTPSHLAHRFKGVFLKKTLIKGKQSFVSKEIFIKNRISYKVKKKNFYLFFLDLSQHCQVDTLWSWVRGYLL